MGFFSSFFIFITFIFLPVTSPHPHLHFVNFMVNYRYKSSLLNKRNWWSAKPSYTRSMHLLTTNQLIMVQIILAPAIISCVVFEIVIELWLCVTQYSILCRFKLCIDSNGLQHCYNVTENYPKLKLYSSMLKLCD